MTNEYKDLVRTILHHGTDQECRNGSQRIIPHYAFTLDFSDPTQDNHILKLRKMYYKGVLGEFKTLIDSEQLTSVTQFEVNGCNYWQKWAGTNGALNLDYYNMLHPQLEWLIENIKADPNSRRHLIELWNYNNVEDGVLSLPCCWHGLNFSVINGVVHLKWTQRSVDTMLGLPADIYLAYKFMQLVTTQCNLRMGTCMFSLSNVHIYEEHLENAAELLDRNRYDCDKPLKFELKE